MRACAPPQAGRRAAWVLSAARLSTRLKCRSRAVGKAEGFEFSQSARVDARDRDGQWWEPVSYTHLTLPTIYSV